MTVDHDSRPLAGMTSLVEHDSPVDDYCGDTDRILEWIGERRAIGDGGWIEDHEVGGQAILDQPAIGDVQLRGPRR